MGATTHRIHRICSGVYYVGAITGDEVKIVSRWHPEFHQDMWHGEMPPTMIWLCL